jgi:hypothetical protein
MLLEKPKGAIKNGQFREIKGNTKQIMIRPAAIQQVDKPNDEQHKPHQKTTG